MYIKNRSPDLLLTKYFEYLVLDSSNCSSTLSKFTMGLMIFHLLGLFLSKLAMQHVISYLPWLVLPAPVSTTEVASPPNLCKQRPTPAILSWMPPELILLVADFLDPIATAALSLTCKGLYSLLHSRLQELHTDNRIEFLLLLERDEEVGCRCYYCDVCHKLHPFLYNEKPGYTRIAWPLNPTNILMSTRRGIAIYGRRIYLRRTVWEDTGCKLTKDRLDLVLSFCSLFLSLT